MNIDIQIISIEGNIGSGKTTLLHNLKKHFNNNPNIIFLKEPVDEWSKIRDENDVTILEKFYADQEKYSFPFQMMAYISRLNLLKDTIKQIKSNLEEKENNKQRILIITERSLFTDKMVFAKMLYDSKKIDLVNYKIYLNWFNSFADDYPISKIIYVKTEPDICHERICKRNRDGEDNIPLDYLNSCDLYHENMLNKESEDCVCHCQLVLDGNNDIYENESILNQWIESIEDFIFN